MSILFLISAFQIFIFPVLLAVIFLAGYWLFSFMKGKDAKRQYNIQLENELERLTRVNAELIELYNIEKFLVSGRISRMIAHEVRNPLTNISLAAEQLAEFVVKNEDAEMLLTMIKRNSLRINEFVTELLNSTKFSALEKEVISVHELLDTILELVKERINHARIRIVRDYCSNPCLVYVDPKLMGDAFLNILMNAIEATSAGKGEIEIRTQYIHQYCIVFIKDNGQGMDKESQSRIFEPYFTSKPNSNGLGLTKALNIILNHKGNIQVQSNLGEGTVFSITLHIEDNRVKGHQVDGNEMISHAASGG